MKCTKTIFNMSVRGAGPPASLVMQFARSEFGRRRIKVALSALMIAVAASISFAVYDVANKGMWPTTWPKELEPLRKQSRTLVHGSYGAIYEIRFTNRAEFERAWPHILGLKSKEAPVTLLSSLDKYRNMGDPIKAGVRILSPRTSSLVTPKGTHYPPGAESAIPDGKFLRIGPPWPDHIKSASGALPEYVAYENDRWTPFSGKQSSNYVYVTRARLDIELIVDGHIVDLNRIPLPADTPIADQRFKAEPRKADPGDGK